MILIADCNLTNFFLAKFVQPSRQAALSVVRGQLLSKKMAKQRTTDY
jgi:hypothetical protein